MKLSVRGWLPPIIACALALGVAHAAPDRLNDDVPDAIPDHKGALSLSYGYESLGLEGPGGGETTAHQYYKLRYTFSDKVALSFRLSDHDLAGGLGLLTPILDYNDSATSYGADLIMNLLNIPVTPADPDNGVAFAAGSSFNAGVGGTRYQLTASDLNRDETEIRAFLTYSTDLTEEMRAHTYFSTGRLSGDTHTGSMNRVGAGLDYLLAGGRRPLVLMANGILDIYNFREPTFNTSRISRFDMGLRYRVARDWYASVGWVTANDSENEASGSGFYAGVNFLNHPTDATCATCPPGGAAGAAGGEEAAPVETPTEEAPPPPQEVQSAVRGVAIPNFQEIPPRHTTDKSKLVRAGQGEDETPPPPPAEEPTPQPDAAPSGGDPPPTTQGDAVETVVQPQGNATGGEEQPDAG